MNNFKDDKNENEWSFKIERSEVAPSEVKEIAPKKSVVEKAKSERLSREREKKRELLLDDVPKETLTRRQLADQMKSEDAILEHDVFHYAHPIKRLLATVIDIFVFFVTIYISRFLLLPIFLVLTNFITHYKLEVVINQKEFFYYGDYIIIFLDYFLVFVISTAFYNKTIGKKFLGLMVREDERFTLNVMDTFIREMILKPISILSIVGGAMAFFHKQRKCLHDLFLKTIVIDD